MSTVPPGLPAQPPAKKTSPLIWILGGIAVLLFGGMLMCGAVGFFGLHMLKNAGFDSQLMKSNPGLAIAKMVAATNPNLELVSSDDSAGTVTMRDRKTGQTVTYRFDKDRQKLEIVGGNGEHVTINGQGNQGSVTVESKDGTIKYGAGADAGPSWAPVYPGSATQATVSSDAKDGKTHQFTFKSTDSPGKVMQYYQDHLKAAGFTVSLVSGGDQGGMVSGEDSSKKRTVIVAVGASNGGADGTVTAVEKP